MPARLNLVGQKYGRLTVVASAGVNKHHHSMFRCRCDCGREITTGGSYLRNGDTKSCGCLQPQIVGKLNHTHGLSKTPEYMIWASMIARCNRAKDRFYADYGGRGIRVCDRWLAFENFIFDMGFRPSKKHSLDRRDNDGNYEPENCRWATQIEQANNKSDNTFIVTGDERVTLAEAARRAGIPYNTICSRMRLGWRESDLLIPSRRGQRRPA